MMKQSIALRLPRLAIIVTIAVLLFSSVVYPEAASTEVKSDLLRFDAILELTAPIIGTHVTLFARYWVTPRSYSISVLWVEPHVSRLNFPTYPPTLNIHSSRQSFSIVNQIRVGNNATFFKPLGERGVFRNKLNVYTLANIRFAESEAAASRIYTSDVPEIGQSGHKAVELRDSVPEQSPGREVARLNLDMKDGRLKAVKLIDPNKQLIKSIEYEYGRRNGQDMLRRQNIVLPESTLTVGYQGRGATIRIAGDEQTYKELPGIYHSGGRTCEVEYRPLRASHMPLSVPAQITVRNAQTNEVLRIARMFNFVALEMEIEEARRAAAQFSRLDDNELKVREFWEKCWEQDADAVEQPDGEVVKRLCRHFKSLDLKGKTIGHKLRRINMLMQLDWIQGDDADLREHFEQYLEVLTSNGLGNTALAGGLHVIHSTVGWRRFSAADRLLADWIDNVIATCDAKSILGFAHANIRRRRCWTAAALLRECAGPSRGWGTMRFNAQALRFRALYDLWMITQEAEKAKSTWIRSQVTWAARSAGSKELLMTAHKSAAKALELYAELDEPTQAQRKLKRQVDRLEAMTMRARN